jgi:hypothetical protein
LNKVAFKYPLKRSNYDFKKAKAENLDGLGGSEYEYIPNVPLNSNIAVYEDFAAIWKMLPDYAKIRVPELIFSCQSDGYNINNLYRNCAPYKNEYKFSLLFIQTVTGRVFGAFLDEVFRKSPKDYVGSAESFVFTLKPEVKVFYDAGVNSRYLLGELQYF